MTHKKLKDKIKTQLVSKQHYLQTGENIAIENIFYTLKDRYNEAIDSLKYIYETLKATNGVLEAEKERLLLCLHYDKNNKVIDMLETIEDSCDRSEILCLTYGSYYRRVNWGEDIDKVFRALSVYFEHYNINPLSLSIFETYLLADNILYFYKESEHVFSHVDTYPQDMFSIPITDNYIKASTGLKRLPEVQYIAVILDIVRKMTQDNIFDMLELLSRCVSYLEREQISRDVSKMSIKSQAEVRQIGFFYDWIKRCNKRGLDKYVHIVNTGFHPDKKDVEEGNVEEYVETFDFFSLKTYVDSADIDEFTGVNVETLFNTYFVAAISSYHFPHVYFDSKMSMFDCVPMDKVFSNLTVGTEFVDVIEFSLPLIGRPEMIGV